MAGALKLAVIGDPIDHTRSPAIHTAAMSALGIDGSYVALRIGAEELADAVDMVRRGEYDGFNVTMPHKRDAADLVDILTPEARRSTSVNTIVREADGRLVGHSTDITALRRLWRSRGLPEDQPVLLLGAGGAAAAACVAAIGSAIYASARRPEAVAAMSDVVDVDIHPLAWGVAVVDAVLVNATTLGMHGEALPDPLVRLASGLIDLTYGPQPSPAVLEAASRGLPVVEGLEVLVTQAADSFRLWTGREPPTDVMMEAARNPSRPL